MLGLRFSRLVHAAIASGALVLGACTGDVGDTDGTTDPTTTTDGTNTDAPTTTFEPPPPPPPPPGDITPPALVAVSLPDPFTLQLSFTEAIAPVDDVNPKRFRLSFARGYDGTYGGDPYVTLLDPRFYNLAQTCTPSCYYGPDPYYCYYEPHCYYTPTGPIDVFDVMNHYSDPTSIVLALTTPIQPSLCDVLSQASGPFTFVLHLHYASGGLAQVTDLAGLPLPSLADGWVKNNSEYLPYHDAIPFTNFNPFLPIVCGF